MSEIRSETLVETGLVTAAFGLGGVARTWNLRVMSGREKGLIVAVGGSPLVIGADGDCGLVLSDSTVSRHHAEISLTPAGLCVRDLKSTNGTYYQSSRISEIVLPAEATIKVGKTRIQLSPVAPASVKPSSRRRFGGLVGDSLAMREVFAVLELASPSEATVLIEGESGTGKELAARAIHDHSGRASGPFVIVDCSATQEHLIDSQLFGHVRGAFTGAVSARKGAFVEATGGTLFLDEIGELPLPSQAKLLRAVEAQTVQPLGSDKPVQVNTRVVAATHRSLRSMIQDRTFRFDLYQRLAVVHLLLPPLRDRLEDLPGLIRLFYEDHQTEPGEIGGQSLKIMERYDWPGNVREVRNVLERAWVLCGQNSSGFEQLQPWLQLTARPGPAEVVDATLPFKEAKENWLGHFERRYLDTVFCQFDRNISRAAEHAGINRNHFKKLLEKHGLLKE